MTVVWLIALIVFAIGLNVYIYRAERQLNEQARSELGRALGNHPDGDWPIRIGGHRTWQ